VSIDKPSGSGDTQPDQPQRPEHKPFPGQPDRLRPAPPPPADNRTAGQLRAERAQYTSVREYAQAKETEKAAAAREKTPARESSDPGTTEKTTPARTVPRSPHEEAPAAEAPAARADSPRAAHSTHGVSEPGSDQHPGQPEQHKGTSPAGRNGGIETGQPPEKPGPAHDADATARPDEPVPGPRRDNGPPAEGTFGPHLSWSILPPEARTTGDTTPTGIGRKPDGEQLLETDAKGSRLDALRKKAYEAETIEDVHDAVDEYADPLEKLFDRPPTSSHADVPVHHPLYSPAESEHAAANEVVMATLVAGVIAFEGGRAARHAVHNLKDKAHDLIERYQHAGD
jgi:hypothetical protein